VSNLSSQAHLLAGNPPNRKEDCPNALHLSLRPREKIVTCAGKSGCAQVRPRWLGASRAVAECLGRSPAEGLGPGRPAALCRGPRDPAPRPAAARHRERTYPGTHCTALPLGGFTRTGRGNRRLAIRSRSSGLGRPRLPDTWSRTLSHLLRHHPGASSDAASAAGGGILSGLSGARMHFLSYHPRAATTCGAGSDVPRVLKARPRCKRPVAVCER
jgi:hypothetical protein